MKTPICDFVKKYAETKKIRLHMPGHKGSIFLGPESYDITEIEGADVLYNASGIIKESEENASVIFGTERTLYSTEGSSLSIRAMLYLALLYGKSRGQKPVILAGRNAHKVFMTAAALLDLQVKWICSECEDSIISCNISGEMLESYLSVMEEKPAAVYVTSPDYLGRVLNIGELAEVCHKHEVLLIVDNAHGAYLKFLPTDMHPISLGADMCCDSAHKTLPVLTGGGYLHISQKAPKLLADQAENAMSLFASTSPSYLILQSLDMTNKCLSEDYASKISNLAAMVDRLKRSLINCGYTILGEEFLKLTISTKSYGYRGDELAKILSQKQIECEFSDPDYLVMMFTPEISEENIDYIKNTLMGIEKKAPMESLPPKIPKLNTAMSIREASFSASEEVPVDKCCNRILASASVTCPPAIPIVVCGEKINEEAIKCFKYYGIKTCHVVI